MNTLSPRHNNQSNKNKHTLLHSLLQPRTAHFALRVSLVSGDEGNFEITIVHKEEAQRLYAEHKANIPEGYHRKRNIARLFVADHHPKQEAGGHKNSSKTTYVERFVVTPGSSSPRFAQGRSIMGIVYQHKPILTDVKGLYAVKQVG